MNKGNAGCLKNRRGLTLVEMLISIGVGSVVIAMLMSILSSSLLTKNLADHENKLLNESYSISEYIQQRVFDLGVRSIEDISPETSENTSISTNPDIADDQTIRMNHEYDIVQSTETGVVYRNYENAESFILHYDSSDQSLHYGPASEFDTFNYVFINPDDTRINSSNVTVDNITSIDYTCIAESVFDNESDLNDGETAVPKCSSAIIEVNITLNFRINDDPLFKPMRFETTIIF